MVVVSKSVVLLHGFFCEWAFVAHAVSLFVSVLPSRKVVLCSSIGATSLVMPPLTKSIWLDEIMTLKPHLLVRCSTDSRLFCNFGTCSTCNISTVLTFLLLIFGCSSIDPVSSEYIVYCWLVL